LGRIHPEFVVASYRITTIRKAKQEEDGVSMNESTMGWSERLPFDPEGHRRRRRAPPFRTNPFGMLVVLALAIGMAMALVASVSLPSTRSATAAPNDDNLLAPSQLSIIDLGTLPGGDGSIAFGINDSGLVVGACETASGYQHACLWNKGKITDLGTLPGGEDYSTANAINSRGQVVGRSNTASGEYHALLWTK
jgi:probable HAF family extracellular repeat protein